MLARGRATPSLAEGHAHGDAGRRRVRSGGGDLPILGRPRTTNVLSSVFSYYYRVRSGADR